MAITLLYTVFQLDLEAPGIPGEDFSEIIDRCYAPLLDICSSGIPLGLEMTGLTMVEIARIRPAFIDDLAMLVREGRAELIGSGYSRAVFPLVPTDVNRWNIEAGVKIYRKFLGMRPATAVLGEESLTRGVIDLYREAGYDNIIIVRSSGRYQQGRLHRARRVAGLKGSANLLVADLESGRRFTDCVRAMSGVEEYSEFLRTGGADDAALSLYAGPAEVFDYSPSRGFAESGEVGRIGGILKELDRARSLRMVTPTEAMERLREAAGAHNVVHLDPRASSAGVVEIEDVNPLLWNSAVAIDPRMSSSLHEAYGNIRSVVEQGAASPGELKGLKEVLCRLWGMASQGVLIDERQKQFNDLVGWLTVETKRLISRPAGMVAAKVAIPGAIVFSGRAGGSEGLPECCMDTSPSKSCDCGENRCGRAAVTEEGPVLRVETGEVTAEFIRDRGLSIKSLVFPNVSQSPVMGTLFTGSSGSSFPARDYFSGHVVLVAPDGTVSTDLDSPGVHDVAEDASCVTVSTTARVDSALVVKVYRISKTEPRVEMTVRIRSAGLRLSSLRTGNFTFDPTGFDRGSLWLETINGGPAPERYALEGLDIPRTANTMALATAGPSPWCLGATDGWVRAGDADKTVEVSRTTGSLHTIPVVSYIEPDSGLNGWAFVMRLSHTTGGIGDPSTQTLSGVNEAGFAIRAWRNNRT